MKEKICVGILGCTGLIGQTYVSLLKNHPWFEIGFLASSEKSSNQTYEEAVEGRWRFETPVPKNLLVHPMESLKEAKDCSLIFSALPNPSAENYEKIYLEAGFPVISSASYARMLPDVPLIIPEINTDHLKIIDFQRKKRGWKGFLIAKPNCSIQCFMLPLTILHMQFKIKQLCISTMQAISGAGISLPSHVIHDNIIPFIADEEEKVMQEPLKIWGKQKEEGIAIDPLPKISAHCNRVPILNGHMACLSVSFERRPSKEEILNLWKNGYPSLGLPSSPNQTIIYHEQPDRPQSRDCLGMEVICGRLRPCPIFDFRFVGLSHNTLRGGAGGGILIAELLKKEEMLG